MAHESAPAIQLSPKLLQRPETDPERPPQARRAHLMMDFLPNSRARLPTFSTNCPDGVSFCPDGVSFCPDFHPNPCSLLRRHTPLSGICTYIKRPPNPTPKHRFSKTAPARPRPAPRPPAPAPARRRRAQREKMRSKWSASTCRAPRDNCSANAAVRERQRICDGVNEAA